MDAKFRQLNSVRDVREWEITMIPSIYNAGIYLLSNTLCWFSYLFEHENYLFRILLYNNFNIIVMPALYVTSELPELDLPNYIHYGLTGFTMGHELGHVLDKSTNYNHKRWGPDNFAWCIF